jgi:hypothetical protein
VGLLFFFAIVCGGGLCCGCAMELPRRLKKSPIGLAVAGGKAAKKNIAVIAKTLLTLNQSLCIR